MDKIINIAVVAHVDAGKSTLVDALLQQNGVFQTWQGSGIYELNSCDFMSRPAWVQARQNPKTVKGMWTQDLNP